jgi:hypothetical protein
MLALLRTTHNYRGFSFKAKARTAKERKPTSTVHPLLQAVQAVDDSGFCVLERAARIEVRFTGAVTHRV